MVKAVNFYTTAGLNRFSGYGKLERGLLRGLYGAGVQVQMFGGLGTNDYQSLPIEQRSWVTAKVTAPVHDVIVTARPENCTGWHTQGKRVWLYTMSESDRVSRKWVHAINQWCTGVLVPCAELVEVYHNSGVDVPVFDVGLGVDYYEPLQTPKWPSEVYTFLTYSYGDMRKGAHLAIQAFKMAFDGNPERRLWIKAREIKGNWLEGCRDEQIEIIEGDFTEAEWFELLWKADAFVFPSYGEGFGLPPREATLVDTPALATQWLGMADVDQWGIPLRVGQMRAAHFGREAANAKECQWAEPDLDHLVEQMVWVSEHQSEAADKAKAGREYLMRNFSWERTTQRILEVLDGYNDA